MLILSTPKIEPKLVFMFPSCKCTFCTEACNELYLYLAISNVFKIILQITCLPRGNYYSKQYQGLSSLIIHQKNK
ncbi:hypothetical protein HOLleu_27367 [Holothuria leucospilota]|uniref:Uncharacterized protein n=1 Tax=Holothuria leucospilota TaxID=206669 RepID=A0A9Q1BQB0_HOLLE|nr:hypothetical protein HOLleu_27367 [Holothuria leucospilota]